MSKKMGSYHHGDLRRALLEWGLALLEEADGADLALRKLARLAGVSPGAVYRHFANKEDLLVALAVEGFDRLNGEQASAYRDHLQESGSTLEAFRAGGLAYVKFALRHPALFRLMFGRFTATHGNEALVQASRENGQAMMQAVRRFFGPHSDDEQLKHTCVGAWSVVHGLSSLLIDQQLRGETDNFEAMAEGVIRDSTQWPECK